MPVGEDWRLVVLSFLVAAAGSFTALELTGPAAAGARPRTRLAWTFAAIVALSIGVWSMHFVAMQALEVNLPVTYDIALVVASFLVAMAGGVTALWLAVRDDAKHGAVVVASVLLGLSLAGMHYTGMAALRMPARVDYDPRWVAISIAIAIVTSYMAFRLIAQFTARRQLRHLGPKTLAALAMGIAIVSVHYTGMEAAHFTTAALPADGVVVDQNAVAIIVSGAALAILAMFLFAAIVNVRRTRRQREQQRYRMLAESVPNLMWTADADGIVDFCNARFAEYTGKPAESLARGGWNMLLHEDDAAHSATAWRAAVAAGSSYRAEGRLRRYDGGFRWHVMLAVPMRDEQGQIVKWFGSCTDIGDQKDAERILSVLADVTEALASSLDPIEIARALAAVVAPAEAVYCEVQLYADRGDLTTVARAGEPSAFGSEGAVRAARAQRAGATMLTRELNVVPVRVSDELLGWLVCCGVGDDVRALVPELASRLGGAIVNAKAYAREHRVATTFQRAALEQNLPDVPGVRFSALYQAAHAEASVGGDWYDAFRLPDGRIVFSVGDVAGSGLEAAVTMGSVRQSIRTAVLINPDPMAVLDAVDRIVRAMRNDRFVTAFVAVLDPVCGELTVANAGHPSPLLRHPDGRVEELTPGDLPLGLRQRGPANAVAVAIEPGTLIVGYTDGLTEAERDPLAGQAQLLGALDVHSNGAIDAQRIFDAVSGGKPARDDVAVLTVAIDALLTQVDGPRRAERWTFDVADEERAAEIRRLVVRRLAEAGLGSSELSSAELVFGELIGNVYRHARGAVDVLLDTSGAAAVLHVIDRGDGFEFRPRLPADLLAERGRGLFLINAFTDEFSMERRRGGGSHARAVLLGRTRAGTLATMARTTL